MLKQVRHISEGNFYGLRVTNKARKLNLEKEIRTLEACKDVQWHVYRKEEKELIDTLKRLQRSKHDPFSHYEYLDSLQGLTHPHAAVDGGWYDDRNANGDLRKTSSTENKHRNDAKQTRRGFELGEQSSSLPFSSQDKPDSDASDVSVIISLSPIASSTVVSKQSGEPVNLPPVQRAKELGTEIHRTQAFTSCAICAFPRHAQGWQREGRRLCNCHVHDLTKHPHAGHEHQLFTTKGKKSNTSEEDIKQFGAKRERKRSLEIEDLIHANNGLPHSHEWIPFHQLHAPHRPKHSHESTRFHPTHVPHRSKHVHEAVPVHLNHASHRSQRGHENPLVYQTHVTHRSQHAHEGVANRSGHAWHGPAQVHESRPGHHSRYSAEGRKRTSSFEEGNQDTRRSRENPGRKGSHDDSSSHVPDRHLHHGNEHEKPSRGRSFDKGRSRENSFDDGRTRRGSMTEGRSRANSHGEHDDTQHKHHLKEHPDARHFRVSNKGVAEEELRDLYLRLHKMFRGHNRQISEQHHTEEVGQHQRGVHLPWDHHSAHVNPAASQSRRKEAANEDQQDPTPAFSGLVHPDNVINHHHFLPYEATERDKRRDSSRQSQRRLGIHVHGVDRHGNRQDVSSFLVLLRGYVNVRMAFLLKVFWWEWNSMNIEERSL